ncbi:MAG TPA: NADH pyrophosphatase zinc ribbon domain-containing protein, partial [Pseudonocardiaceae bacterium]|nr:NADH pyrophosphatase zinc ribbon domain-containing protein [Pseudonocardiaceae bacterium]
MTEVPFQLTGRPVLSRATVRRDEDAALDDPDRRSALWSAGRVLPVDQFGCAPVLGQRTLGLPVALAYRPTEGELPESAVLLGERDGVGYWATPITREDAAPPDWRRVWSGVRASADEQWVDLRSVGALLDATDAGVFTTASALFNWHRVARFCARCGAPTRLERAGWTSRCTDCGREEYPRTDPAVICLVHDGIG